MDIKELMEQAKKMQEDLGNIEQELQETIYEGNNGGEGGVTIKINGRFEMQECIIAEELYEAGDREMLQDMILIAQNEAVNKANQDRADKMGQATEGLDIELPEL